MTPFHLAFRIDDIESTRAFYGGLLDCQTGRETGNWIDFDFFGHQISAHIGPRPDTILQTLVGGIEVPLAHFGAVLPWETWQALAERLTDRGAEFVITPQVRFAGEPGEQGTFFVRDPSGNALEFKAFRNAASMFDATTTAGAQS
ncbi:VOC family protein [Sphingomonas sp. R86521]|uniref:VOC family protein n=1 Tax=Sphingomonas sp. R86521 TaxID=3093860 RepID=UPI0036D41D45